MGAAAAEVLTAAAAPIIPALAGNTVPTLAATAAVSGHPRVGGEHLTRLYQIADSETKRGVGWKSDPPRN